MSTVGRYLTILSNLDNRRNDNGRRSRSKKKTDDFRLTLSIFHTLSLSLLDGETQAFVVESMSSMGSLGQYYFQVEREHSLYYLVV